MHLVFTSHQPAPRHSLRQADVLRLMPFVSSSPVLPLSSSFFSDHPAILSTFERQSEGLNDIEYRTIEHSILTSNVHNSLFSMYL